MKKNKLSKIFSVSWVKYGLLLILGIFLGWLFFHSSGGSDNRLKHTSEVPKAAVWTCSMHPQIRMEEPGKCPICGMDLIPLAQAGTSQFDPDAIHISKEAAELANVLTTKVSTQNPVKEVRLYGKVQVDERLFQSQVSHVPGRIEQLFVNFTGEQVRKGQKLAEIYSPELVTAQQELLETIKTKQLQPELYDASKEKLRQWKLSDDQIELIESSGKIINNFDVLSNTSGTVTARRVSAGDHISQGTVLFDIADLSNVWILFDAYETDLPFIRQGQKVKFSIQAIPGTEFSGNIVFIDPVIDPVTRVAKVRVEASNPLGKLKPEMFATGVILSNMKEYQNNIVIPKTAVLWTGKRSIVYVKEPDTDEPVFRLREVGLGPLLGDGYVVTDGLSEGEEIVTNGTFSVDAAAQLDGKPSMMNPSGGRKTSSMPGMAMPGDAKAGDTKAASDTGMAGMDMSGNKSAAQEKRIGVSRDFTMQLNSVFDKYIQLKDAFVQSDAKSVNNTAREVQQALSKVDMKLLANDAHTQWMEILGKLDKQIKLIISSAAIEDQRRAFSEFSNQFYKAIKTFGLMGKTTYYQFCPMAFGNKGAYWLSESRTIRNPYFGEKMMDCGDTREILSY